LWGAAAAKLLGISRFVGRTNWRTMRGKLIDTVLEHRALRDREFGSMSLTRIEYGRMHVALV